ncbi:MAG: aminoacyl-histidine dipeptidase [Saprospiraceae bacterium]|nr:aminoacyl-histidine dipeptidase [Saprospiraceae bacterium]
MNSEIQNLEPRTLWKYFSEINAIPRPSKKEEKISEFMLSFGKRLGLVSEMDEVGNVLIKKSATPGMESKPTIILQSHLDMVHQKNNETNFDFENEGIKMYINDGWVRADGTTLGADNGIGVASIMAILASDEISHPSIEALFTIDEETGMTGAKSIKEGWLKGKILLNLDTEEDDEIDIGCAGGLDVTATRTYHEAAAQDGVAIAISVKGLQGGHSGIDIDKGRANSNKVLIRLVYKVLKEENTELVEFEGGSLRNAIPRESRATLWVPRMSKDTCLETLSSLIKTIQSEYQIHDPGMEVKVESSDFAGGMVCDRKDAIQLINAVYAAHNGVFRMSPDVEGLVEASNNVAKVTIKEGNASVLCLTRSSVESTKLWVAESLHAVFALAGFDVQFSGDYPGWAPNRDSQILHSLVESYKTLFKSDPKVVACHAGLECGIIGSKVPGLDMISFGPTIKGAHSPDEKVNITSVEKFWTLLLYVLKNIDSK